jgi:hypothetical protein
LDSENCSCPLPQKPVQKRFPPQKGGSLLQKAFLQKNFQVRERMPLSHIWQCRYRARQREGRPAFGFRPATGEPLRDADSEQFKFTPRTSAALWGTLSFASGAILPPR